MFWNRTAEKNTYKLNKSREILNEAYKWFKKNKPSQPDKEFDTFEANLRQLDKSVYDKRVEDASAYAKKVEVYLAPRNTKGILYYAFEIITALIVALVIATIVRQMWFEIYEIPTGSMRPTFKEKDHVTVSKTAFGINIPLKTDHFMFDPALVKRAGVIIFSSDKLPLSDTDSTYFGVLPYKKRFVKRLIGKPGDTLYFYGGKVYGIDRDGNEIRDLIDTPNLERIEYIPFISFEGTEYSQKTGETVLLQFRKPIGLLVQDGIKQTRGLINRGDGWVADNPSADKTAHDRIETYADFFGMKNFGMARLLTKEQVTKAGDYSVDKENPAELFLEVKHTPSLTYPTPAFDSRDWYQPWQIPAYTTLIPLSKNHVEEIMSNMYTARFVVKNGRARRYQVDNTEMTNANPLFPGVPDGTYEFYYGKAYSIGFGGVARLLDKSHPLYNSTPAAVQKLFNLGIDFDTSAEPSKQNKHHYPKRFAYYRDGELFLLGAPVFKKDDPTLTAFLEKELEKEKKSTGSKPYVAFKDYGPPYKNGVIDTALIKAAGLKIPEKNYLVLGDNHAMSGDSRSFGFLPEENIQGVPSLIIWPYGERWGFPNQLCYPFATLPRIIVWSLAAVTVLLLLLFRHRRNSQPFFPENR